MKLSKAEQGVKEILKNDETLSEEDITDELEFPLFARDKALGWILVVAGFISWVASGALILDRLKIYENPTAVASCDLNSWIACGQVMRTPQAAIFGFPNPFIGLAAFSALIAIGFTLIAGAKFANWFWIGLQVGVTAGMALVAWFWYTALFTIGILCPYCMVVWAMMIPVFLIVTSRNILNSSVISGKKWLLASTWTVPTIIGVYLVVIASIIIRFAPLIFGGIS